MNLHRVRLLDHTCGVERQGALYLDVLRESLHEVDAGSIGRESTLDGIGIAEEFRKNRNLFQWRDVSLVGTEERSHVNNDIAIIACSNLETFHTRIQEILVERGCDRVVFVYDIVALYEIDVNIALIFRKLYEQRSVNHLSSHKILCVASGCHSVG